MGKEYFNRHNFSKAVNMINEDIYLAIELFKQYTENFPNDYMAMIYYASALITVKKMEEAKQVLNNLKIQLNNDKKFTYIDGKISVKEMKKDLKRKMKNYVREFYYINKK